MDRVDAVMQDIQLSYELRAPQISPSMWRYVALCRVIRSPSTSCDAVWDDSNLWDVPEDTTKDRSLYSFTVGPSGSMMHCGRAKAEGGLWAIGLRTSASKQGQCASCESGSHKDSA